MPDTRKTRLGEFTQELILTVLREHPEGLTDEEVDVETDALCVEITRRLRKPRGPEDAIAMMEHVTAVLRDTRHLDAEEIAGRVRRRGYGGARRKRSAEDTTKYAGWRE